MEVWWSIRSHEDVSFEYLKEMYRFRDDVVMLGFNRMGWNINGVLIEIIFGN